MVIVFGELVDARGLRFTGVHMLYAHVLQSLKERPIGGDTSVLSGYPRTY